MKVGVVGVGRIGAPLVARLVAAGHHVVATDVRPERCAEAESAGGVWAPDAPAVAGAAGVVLTALPGTPEIRELALGPGGLLACMRAGTVWVDLTSATPEFGRECGRLADARGVGYLDAPIGGGVPAMRGGAVTLYAGGDAGALRDTEPLLRSFAGTVRHTGGNGTGYLAKLLVNLLWFGHATLTTEALLLARRHGLAPDRMRELILGGAGDSAFVARYLPALLDGDYLSDFGLDRCVEELDAIEATAERAAVPHPVTSAVAGLHRAALRRYGAVDGELLAAALLEEQAGITLRRGDAG